MATTKYDLFKIKEWNRKILAGHVEKIKKSINTIGYLKYNPIIVDKDYYILDWQHRFHACMQLWLPIYYEVEKWNTEDIMIQLNSTSKEWSLINYIDFYADKWWEWYIYFNNFLKEYNLNQTSALAILTEHNGGSGKKIKAGWSFEIPEYAEFIWESINLFGEDLDFAKNRVFIRALIKLYLRGWKAEVKKLLSRALRIKKQVNLSDYLIVFENILNKWRDPKNFISL